jgi:putative transposase
MSERMTAKLACDALKMALQRRKKPRDIIVHTDSKNVGVSFHHHACCFARPVRSLMQ